MQNPLFGHLNDSLVYVDTHYARGALTSSVGRAVVYEYMKLSVSCLISSSSRLDVMMTLDKTYTPQ